MYTIEIKNLTFTVNASELKKIQSKKVEIKFVVVLNVPHHGGKK